MTNSERKYKVIVFHPMQQHSYKTAEALLNDNLLFSYCTSIYYNPKKLVYKFLNFILPKKENKKMKSRSSHNLDKYVKTFNTLYGFLFLLVERIDKSKNKKYVYKFQDIITKKMGKKVAKYAIKNKVDAIIGYDTWSYGAIKELKKRKSNIKFIIDYSSLYAEEILSIIKNDIEKNPISIDSYSKSLEKFKDKYMENFIYEKDNCDYFLSASTVTDDSLIKYEVNKDNIYRCTYGNYFPKSDQIKKNNTNKLVFTYVGRISYAKGVHYLLDAFSKLKRNDFILQLVGKNVDNINLQLEDDNIIYLGVKLHSEIPDIMANTDVFITATLYDGFSLAILEGFSYNIPVICTEKTGIKDYIKNGFNGFVVKECDSDELVKILNYLLNNKYKVNVMKNNIKDSDNKLTWEKYNIDVIKAIKSILNIGEKI